MKKKKISIMLDFGEGPLWTKYYDKNLDRLITGIFKIDNDKKIWELNDKIQDLYSSYYHFNYKGKACYFDEEQEKKDKYKMLALLEELIKRLEELNDGSFEIDDEETQRVKEL